MAGPGERPDEGSDPTDTRPAEKDVQRDDRRQAAVFARPGDERGHEIEGPEKHVEQDERHGGG